MAAVGRLSPICYDSCHCCPPIQQAVMQSELDVGHAKILAGLPEVRQMELFNKVLKRKLSVRETKRLAQLT